jgi:hypothetical protein
MFPHLAKQKNVSAVEERIIRHLTNLATAKLVCKAWSRRINQVLSKAWDLPVHDSQVLKLGNRNRILFVVKCPESGEPVIFDVGGNWTRYTDRICSMRETWSLPGSAINCRIAKAVRKAESKVVVTKYGMVLKQVSMHYFLEKFGDHWVNSQKMHRWPLNDQGRF